RDDALRRDALDGFGEQPTLPVVWLPTLPIVRLLQPGAAALPGAAEPE
ncbi:MAG: hypothetical protein ACI9U2_002552, partial [Bradymonadia bacterium]